MSLSATARRQRGVTLLELLVVVALVAFMAAIAGIPVGQTEEQALELGQVQVEDALAGARSRAMSLRAPVGVAFDVVGDRFAVVDSDGTAIDHPLTHKPWIVTFAAPAQPNNLGIAAASFGATGTAIVYDGQGLPMAGGSVTLSAGTSTRVVTVSAATGLVTSP